jgi:hypothetical protein
LDDKATTGLPHSTIMLVLALLSFSIPIIRLKVGKRKKG